MNIRQYILILLFLLPLTIFAQGVKVSATASKTEVGTGEVFEVTFSVNGNVDRFSPPDFSGFQIVGGPNQSSSMESINGNTTMSTSFSYELMPTKEGDFTIGPATLGINGSKVVTNPIKIKVVKGKPVPKANSAQQGQQRQQSPNDVPEGNAADMAKYIFIRASVDKDNVYQGQQLTLTYKVYFRVGILQNQVTKLPDLTGFWNEDVKLPSQQQQQKPRIEVVKGERYNVADLKQIILFPEHAGNITVDPFEMNFIAQIPAPGRDLMQQFFGGGYQNVKYVAKSLPLVVHVRPLPEAGKPASFTGAVGKFDVEASIDKTELKANEALNYKVKVTGSGNIKLLKNLSTNFPADFEKYDPKITDTVTELVSGVSGSRFYNYLMIPRHQGDFTIDPLKFSYFNPATGRYVSLTTKGFKIKVNKGVNESNVTAFSGADKQDIKLLDKDIHYIKTGDAGLSKQGESFYGSTAFIISLLVGPFLALIAFIFRNKNRKYNADVVRVRSRRAGKIAAKRLADAQKQLRAGNANTFYEAIFKGLYGYLGDKLNISAADLNREVIASALAAKSVDEKVIDQLTDTLDLCEMARYAPVTHISEKEVFEKAKGVINDIEDEI